MRFYAQVVSEAVIATPPIVRGMIDGMTIRRLVGWSGVGRSRVLTFDVLGDMTVSRILSMKDSIALEGMRDATPLVLRTLERTISVSCPQCGLDMLSQEFWDHYNTFHARRVDWLNAEDWKKMGIKGPYVTPPEQL